MSARGRGEGSCDVSEVDEREVAASGVAKRGRRSVGRCRSGRGVLKDLQKT